MKKYINIIKKSLLFNGINENELNSMIECLSPKYKAYNKGEFILQAGDKICNIGLVLLGSVHIIKEDFWGNTNIVTKLCSGEFFGETYACTTTEIGVNVISIESSEILFLNINKVLNTCSSACKFHSRLIQNLLSIISQKNILLTKKLEHMSKRTTKEKLLSYLFEEYLKNNSEYFQIPFNRQQLADYLSVDRSAMSNELCKLRDEGIISFYKNQFCLKKLMN